MIGPSGSGKGTQAKLLQERFGYKIISMGGILREEIAKKTELGERAKDDVENGHWVPSELVGEILSQYTDLIDSENIVLDGMVRRIEQVEIVDQFLETAGRELGAAVYLDISGEEAIQRLLSRGREDDTREVIDSRLKSFKEHNDDIIKKYEERGILHKVDGSRSIEEVHTEIVDLLNIS
jgi:adenylate kinase